MNSYLRSVFVLAAAALAAQPLISAAPVTRGHASQFGAIAPAFVRNTGQADPRARFVSIGGGQPIFFTSNDVRIVDTKRQRSLWLTFIDGAARDIDGEWSTGGHVTVLRHATAAADEPIYRDVVYRNVWRGIDARVSAATKGLKYSFEVSPGADPRAIHLRYSGHDAIELTDAGEIVLDSGDATIIDTKPVAFQHINGRTVHVPVRFVQFDADVAFSVGEYDKTQPLTIDPTLVYSTYLGSSGADQGLAIAVDTTGAAYIAGTSGYGDLPVIPGAFQTSWHGDPNTVKWDAFVAKINAAGTHFDYVTYLGGYEQDVARAIAVDASGNAYVTGMTSSGDFPTTSGAYRPTHGFLSDGFLSKLNSTGTALLYSTYLGGNGPSDSMGVSIDASGNAYVVGQTEATNLPVSPSAQPNAVTSGRPDGFLLKFNAAGSQVLYGTYIGGSGNDLANRVTIDAAGRAVVAGITASPTGISHGAPYQPYIGGGVFKSTDAGQSFVAANRPIGTTDSGAFSFDAADSSIVYQITQARGLLKTTNGGASWSQPPETVGIGIQFFDVAANPVNAGFALVSTDTGLWRTDDGFATVSNVGHLGFANHIAWSASLPSTAYVTARNPSTGGPAVFKSTDGGRTWAITDPLPPAPIAEALAVSPANASTVFVGLAPSSSSGPVLLRTTDGGATWTRVDNNPSFANHSVTALAIDPTLTSNIWAGLSSGTVLRSTDNGATWAQATGITVSYAQRMAFDGATLYIADAGDPAYATFTASLHKTADRGTTWSHLSIRGNNLAVRSLAVSGGTVYVGSTLLADAFVWKVDTASTTASILWGTYLGGALLDTPSGLALDGSGDPIVAVSTGSADFPVTVGGAPTAAALVKLSADGSSLVWSEYIAPAYGNFFDKPILAVDRSDNVYAAGSAMTSPSSAVTTWIGRFDPGGALTASFQLGGTQSNVGVPSSVPRGIAAGPTVGDVFITGVTDTYDFPVTANAPQPAYASGAADAFIAKIAFGGTTPPPPPGPNVALSRPVRTSSDFSSQYAGAFAVDGDGTTRWSSQFTDTEWIYVDLGQRYDITEVRLHWETAYGRDFQIQVSDDAASWTTIATLTRNTQLNNTIDASGTGRYVRMNGIHRATEWGYSLWEFEVSGNPATPLSAVDRALNRPAVASSEFSSEYAAGFAVDGNASTRWSSAFSDPQWIYVDLGQTFAVNRVKLTWETAYGRDFQIQVSNDAASWTTIATLTGNTQLTNTIDAPGTGRYVRMNGIHRGTEWGYSLWSFEVYGDPASSPPPPPGNVVVYADDIPPSAIHGSFVKGANTTAAGGFLLASSDSGSTSTTGPLANPIDYVDVPLNVTAGVQYRLWFRMWASGNSKYSDSFWVQFSNAQVNGTTAYQTGTTSALLVNLATDSTASSLDGWGWQNTAYWLSQPTVVTFSASGAQTLRIQVREDGVQFDQVVLSPTQYFDHAPGAATNDATIVPKP